MTRQQLWAEYKSLGLTGIVWKQATISNLTTAIEEHKAASGGIRQIETEAEVAVEAIATEPVGFAGDNVAIRLAPITCANCPYFRNFGEADGRGECCLKGTVSRSHWTQTNDCVQMAEAEEERIAARNIAVAVEDRGSGRIDTQAIAQVELETYIEQQAATVAPETRLEVYRTPDPEVIAVYSYKPEYIKPKRYTVRDFGDDVFSCTCEHHTYKRVDCKHIQEVRRIKLEGFQPEREPYTLEPSIGGGFTVWVGKKYLGKVESPEELYNQYWAKEEAVQRHRQAVMV